MQAHEIRTRFLEFFRTRGHAIIPSASLVPDNDPSVLFNTAGMQPLVPYLLGAPHPQGDRLVNAQKCVRTTDIGEIGDNTHATFFEMLGNWSLGAYFKKEAIEWSYAFLTSREAGLGLDPAFLYVTVFGGNADAPRDEESYVLWREIFDRAGVSGERVYYMSTTSEGKEPNWWSAGENGPCGPDTEMFYDVTGMHGQGMTIQEYLEADARQEVVEIWNDVFMEYEKKEGRVVGKLRQKNVDTGSGLERVAMVVQGKRSIFETDLLAPLVKRIDAERRKYFSRSSESPPQTEKWEKRNRILADHLRTSAFLIADGVVPSNKERGYVLRRLLRRTMNEKGIGIFAPAVFSLLERAYQSVYPDLTAASINAVYQEELTTFLKNARRGFQEITKKYTTVTEPPVSHILTGQDAFYFFSTFGITREVFLDAVEEALSHGRIGLSPSFEVEYDSAFREHQEVSRKGAEQKFKGGLADHSVQSVRYHTATHLLHQALREVLDNQVFQKGSNITPERLRFDFSYSRQMTDAEKRATETLVNQKIGESLPVEYEDLPLAEARKRGAIGLFEEKYQDKVRVYKIGQFSLEFCGGPHVRNTRELGQFRIIKEEACSAGVRRIKAVLE